MRILPGGAQCPHGRWLTSTQPCRTSPTKASSNHYFLDQPYRGKKGLPAELAPAVDHFCKVTASYWSGLFACYQVKDLPRTNNALEQYFGTVRHVERRATGRKRASPALIVRGSVRVVAAGASQFLTISAAHLRVTDEQEWRALRQQLDYRHEARRQQLRFRRDPDVYLARLEQRLLTPRLPS